jgi:hypothetical protein
MSSSTGHTRPTDRNSDEKKLFLETTTAKVVVINGPKQEKLINKNSPGYQTRLERAVVERSSVATNCVSDGSLGGQRRVRFGEALKWVRKQKRLCGERFEGEGGDGEVGRRLQHTRDKAERREKEKERICLEEKIEILRRRFKRPESGKRWRRDVGGPGGCLMISHKQWTAGSVGRVQEDGWERPIE